MLSNIEMNNTIGLKAETQCVHIVHRSSNLSFIYLADILGFIFQGKTRCEQTAGNEYKSTFHWAISLSLATKLTQINLSILYAAIAVWIPAASCNYVLRWSSALVDPQLSLAAVDGIYVQANSRTVSSDICSWQYWLATSCSLIQSCRIHFWKRFFEILTWWCRACLCTKRTVRRSESKRRNWMRMVCAFLSKSRSLLYCSATRIASSSTIHSSSFWKLCAHLVELPSQRS